MGQFCTNPSIAIVTQDQADSIVAAAGGSLRVVTPQVMLTEDLAAAYLTGSQRIARGQSVREIVAPNGSQREAPPFLFTVSGSDVLPLRNSRRRSSARWVFWSPFRIKRR